MERGLKNWLCVRDSLSLRGLEVKYVLEIARWNFAFFNSVMVMCWNEFKKKKNYDNVMSVTVSIVQ